jgi:hypothetical protein
MTPAQGHIRTHAAQCLFGQHSAFENTETAPYHSDECTARKVALMTRVADCFDLMKQSTRAVTGRRRRNALTLRACTYRSPSRQPGLHCCSGCRSTANGSCCSNRCCSNRSCYSNRSSYRAASGRNYRNTSWRLTYDETHSRRSRLQRRPPPGAASRPSMAVGSHTQLRSAAASSGARRSRQCRPYGGCDE